MTREATAKHNPDVVVSQMLANSLYSARTEEGGEIPSRQGLDRYYSTTLRKGNSFWPAVRNSRVTPRPHDMIVIFRGRDGGGLGGVC
jgi:hypothetical protein